MKDFDSKLRLMLCGGRLSLFLAAVAGLLILCVAIGNLSWLYDNPTRRMLIFFLLLPAGLTVTFTWPRNQPPRAQALGILLLALTLRLALIPHPGDSDANRYLWEGRLIREGQNPYALVASR